MTINLLTRHASVRKYKDVKVPKEDLHEIILAGQHAASSNFVQAYSVILVTDPAKREQLATLSKNPQQISTAGAVLVLCMDFYRIEKGASLLGREIDYRQAENLLVATTDVALFAQNIAIAAESKGYGICYIGGVRNAPEEISELLNLPTGVAPMYAMTIGVPDEDNEVKPRLPIEAILHENSYDEEKYNELIPEYDQTMKTYYQNRGTNQKDISWSESMTAFLGTPRRLHMKEFLQKQGFDFK
ncbi:oxygen-insensitive NADPH nitroreductase [Sporosarcina pasteurii]|uniref:FMN reductase (NADPH) n=1 Tax=Sporosarcina pasteurii TaxID=1474 RepID=A0A380CKC2_SPOPA|nr:oxygen-insensitive NADPH nitroreductase [Sporosarcina pasteurii]MDS9472106.1 oxygen-insensitive NADPH nitroreductase [Sporosarcina pasteurii]QBQ06824.1 oxygen-insensitive NADPH nitroreductase [Sporosarcina pasteurii]SUJ20777.1 FMN reductase (NADPH) [Sporosarcina pasteurii]